MRKVFGKKAYSLTAALIGFLLTLLICVAIFLPGNIGYVFEINGTPTKAFGKADIGTQANCSFDSNGVYNPTGSDPQMIFMFDAQEIDAIKFNLSDSADKFVDFEIYLALPGEDFSPERCYAGNVFKENDSAIVDVPFAEYSSMRIDIDCENVSFENIEIYDTQPEKVPFTPSRTKWNYIFALSIPVLAAVVVFILNYKTEFTQKLIEKIKTNKSGILKFIIFSLAALLLAVVMELFAKLVLGGGFNIYRWIFLAGLTELVVVFVLQRKFLQHQPEKIFLSVALTIGLVMVFASPAKHICWDLDSHYPWAVQCSYYDTAYLTQADDYIYKVSPQSLVTGGINLESYQNDLALFNDADSLITTGTRTYFSLPHLPASMVIAVARMFGASFATKYNLGRLAFLLVYAFVCYFGIKKLKSGKMIASIIALFPTNLFLATNYSYDYWITAFTMLGCCYFASEIEQPDKNLTIKDAIIMCGAFVLASLPKLPYILLMGLPFFMRKNWQDKKSRRIYYAIWIAAFASVFVMLMIKSLGMVSGAGDSRVFAGVNPGEQVQYILHNPFAYAKTLLAHFSNYLSIGTMKDYISFFAYLGYGRTYPLLIAALFFAVITDKNECNKFKGSFWISIVSILLYVGIAALISTALYIDFTPVAAPVIQGCQPRYLMPMVIALALMVANPGLGLSDCKHYNATLLSAVTACTMFDVFVAIVRPLM